MLGNNFREIKTVMLLFKTGLCLIIFLIFSLVFTANNSENAVLHHTGQGVHYFEGSHRKSLLVPLTRLWCTFRFVGRSQALVSLLKWQVY